MFDRYGSLRDVRGFLRIAAVGTVLIAPTAALAAATSSPRVLVISCNSEQYRPASIGIACGDGGVLLRKLKWSTWTSAHATGEGQYAINDCSPSCVNGHFRSYPIEVTLSKPKSCPKHSHKAFTHIALVFERRHPEGAATQITSPCPD